MLARQLGGVVVKKLGCCAGGPRFDPRTRTIFLRSYEQKINCLFLISLQKDHSTDFSLEDVFSWTNLDASSSDVPQRGDASESALLHTYTITLPGDPVKIMLENKVYI